jgi:hypothetical protein
MIRKYILLILLISINFNCKKEYSYDPNSIFYLLFMKYDLSYTCNNPEAILKENISIDISIEEKKHFWFDVQDRIDANFSTSNHYLVKIEKNTDEDFDIFILSCSDRNNTPRKVNPEEETPNSKKYKLRARGSNDTSRDIFGILSNDGILNLKITYEGVYIPSF